MIFLILKKWSYTDKVWYSKQFLNPEIAFVESGEQA